MALAVVLFVIVFGVFVRVDSAADAAVAAGFGSVELTLSRRAANCAFSAATWEKNHKKVSLFK